MFAYQESLRSPSLFRRIAGKLPGNLGDRLVLPHDRNDAQYWKQEAHVSANKLVERMLAFPSEGGRIQSPLKHFSDGRILEVSLVRTDTVRTPEPMKKAKNPFDYMDISILNNPDGLHRYFLRWDIASGQIITNREYSDGQLEGEFSDGAVTVLGNKRMSTDDEQAFTPRLQAFVYENCWQIFRTALDALDPRPLMLP